MAGVAHGGAHLLCRHEDQGSGPQNPCKTQVGMTVPLPFWCLGSSNKGSLELVG